MTTARWIVVGFGVLVLCLGATTVVWPDRLVEFAGMFATSRGLWIAVAIRLALGVLLWATAAASRTPLVFRVFGALYFASGIALPILGLDFLRGTVEWGSALDDVALRGIALVAALFGVFFVWSAAPRRSEP
jgi:hypothetical protein